MDEFIYETKNYEKFSFMKGNRLIRTNTKLEASIKKNGIITPIIVNEHFEILGGQHRFNIAKKYNLPISYQIIPLTDINDVIQINSTSKQWTLHDYIHKYALENNKEYIRLSHLLSEYNNIISVSTIAAAAQGFLKLKGISSDNLKKGVFAFYNYKKFCILLDDYKNFLQKVALNKGQFLFFSYFNLYTLNNFDEKRLIAKIIGKESKIKSIHNTDRLLTTFIDMYNKGAREVDKINYHILPQEKNRVEILNKRDLTLINGEGF
jgi:hypothetical protein